MDAETAQSGPPGLDLHRLREYFDAHSPGVVDGPLTADVIAGGKSNLTYRVSGESGSVVLRRPPLAHVLPTAHDMSREYTVIAALHPIGFPVPEPMHLCTDPDVIGAPFYVMSYVDGVVLRDAADVASLSRAQATRTSELLVDTLAALHATDPAEIGLADFGRPEGYLERQVRRWHQQWQASKTRELATLEQVAATLRDTVPVGGRTGIVHGDFRLDNCMYAKDLSRILAVLDWEMATLGDPLADVGLMVVYTELADDGMAPAQVRIGPEQGFLSSTELIDRYADQALAGAAIDRIGWYVALGYYKLAIISEGIHARYLLGMTVGPGFDQMGARVSASGLIDAPSSPERIATTATARTWVQGIGRVVCRGRSLTCPYRPAAWPASRSAPRTGDSTSRSRAKPLAELCLRFRRAGEAGPNSTARPLRPVAGSCAAVMAIATGDALWRTGVRDGDVLTWCHGPGPTRYDDVIEEIATKLEHGRTWDAAATRLRHGRCRAGAFTGLAVLVAVGPPRVVPARPRPVLPGCCWRPARCCRGRWATGWPAPPLAVWRCRMRPSPVCSVRPAIRQRSASARISCWLARRHYCSRPSSARSRSDTAYACLPEVSPLPSSPSPGRPLALPSIRPVPPRSWS
jgi:aminoglycoside phosphotransferase (APT) family kinase protein